jgi:hypothetical protein
MELFRYAKGAVMLGRFILLFVFVAFTTSCTVQVPIDAYEQRLVEQPVHRSFSKVVIYVPPSLAEETFTQRGILAVGTLMQWQIGAAEALTASSKHFFENYFSNVEVVRQSYVRGDCLDCALAVVPKLEKLRINEITMQTTVEMTFAVYDSAGADVIKIPILGKSKLLTLDRVGAGVVAATVPVVSSFAGNSILSRSVEDAFADAFWRAHLEMKEHTEAGALARNWLPRELRKKVEFGRYEFAAERSIIAAGCKLPQDGLRLIKKGFDELYEAYCWQYEPFLLSCSGGQCDVAYSEPSAETSPALASGN